MHRSRAAVRIDDIGGWTDTWFVKKGAVLNFTVNLFAHVMVRRKPPKRQKRNTIGYSTIVDIPDPVLTIRAWDMEAVVEGSVDSFEYDGQLDLLKAAIRRLEIQGGIEVDVWADAPPGAGVGTSAAVGVAMVAALDAFRGAKLSCHQIARLAQALETEELELQCGLQDQFASAFGGISLLEFEYPKVEISPVRANTRFVNELNERLLLVYLGGRLSTDAHNQVIANYEAGDDNIVKAIECLSALPYEAHEAILREDINVLAEVMNHNWLCQRMLHREMASPLMGEVEQVAGKNGAIAVKGNGAGFGGSATIIADSGAEFQLKNAISKIDGVQILPCQLHFGGVESWSF